MKTLSIFALVLIQAVACSAARAVAPEDRALCVPSSINAELAIAACTRMAQAPDIPASERAVAFGVKGALLLNKMRAPDAAIVELNEAIRLSPGYTYALYYRGQAYSFKREFDPAIRDYTESISKSPQFAPAFNGRGSAWSQKGDFARATADFEEALRVSQNKSARAKNDLAWLLATAPDSKFRNGKRAVELAKEACESAQWKSAIYVDTLAAAYAEVGDFAKAVELEQRALQGDTYQGAQREKAVARLETYRQGKPYRDIREKGK